MAEQDRCQINFCKEKGLRKRRLRLTDYIYSILRAIKPFGAFAEEIEMKWNALTERAVEAALKAGAILREGFGSCCQISFKERSQNYVTQYDVMAENAIIDHVHAKYPDHAILVEEAGGRISRIHGEPLNIFRESSVLASNSALYKAMLDMLGSSFMGK